MNQADLNQLHSVGLVPDPFGDDPTCGPIVPMPHPFKKGGPYPMLAQTDTIVSVPYISIDIETTGLNYNVCQILEFGAVIDDWVTPLDKLARFHCYVLNGTIIGEPFALAMNAEILRRIADHKKLADTYQFLPPDQITRMFWNWLRSHGLGEGEKTVAAGKNFGRFDERFLAKLDGYGGLNLLHRNLDPGMMYWNPRIDRLPPDTKVCLQRAGYDGNVKHEAIDDCLDVIRLIRKHVGVPV